MAPEIVLAERVNVLPAQIGALLLAVGAPGIPFTVTVTVPADPPQPLTVPTTEYVPLAAVVAAGMVGFCEDEVNPLGPVQT